MIILAKLSMQPYTLSLKILTSLDKMDGNSQRWIFLPQSTRQ